jgi:hypothetical protein
VPPRHHAAQPFSILKIVKIGHRSKSAFLAVERTASALLVRRLPHLVAAFAVIALPGTLFAQKSSEMIPAVSADAGPCSVEFTVTRGKGLPVHGAAIRVHMEYGFLGLRQKDLQVGTNSIGKARFEGLPEEVSGALFFRASKGDLRGVAAFNPETNCHGKHAIFLNRQWQSANSPTASNQHALGSRGGGSRFAGAYTNYAAFEAGAVG